MKIVALKDIKRLIESKHGRQAVDIVDIGNDTSSLLVIHNVNSEVPSAYMNKDDELAFDNLHDDVHCILLDSDLEVDSALEGFGLDTVYMKLESALNGRLVIDNEVLTEDELENYIKY